MCSAGFLLLTRFRISSVVWAMLSLKQAWSFMGMFRIMNVYCIYFSFFGFFFLFFCIRNPFTLF